MKLFAWIGVHAHACMSLWVWYIQAYTYRHRKQYHSNISFELWWRWWHSNFLISAGELHILLCAEKKLIWTSQIEENESSHSCLLLCLLIVICTEVYPTCCLEILQMLRLTFPGAGNPGNIFGPKDEND